MDIFTSLTGTVPNFLNYTFSTIKKRLNGFLSYVRDSFRIVRKHLKLWIRGLYKPLHLLGLMGF